MYLGIGRMFSDWAYNSAETNRDRAIYGGISSLLSAAIVGNEIGVLRTRLFATKEAISAVTAETKTQRETAKRAA